MGQCLFEKKIRMARERSAGQNTYAYAYRETEPCAPLPREEEAGNRQRKKIPAGVYPRRESDKRGDNAHNGKRRALLFKTRPQETERQYNGHRKDIGPSEEKPYHKMRRANYDGQKRNKPCFGEIKEKYRNNAEQYK